MQGPVFKTEYGMAIEKHSLMVLSYLFQKNNSKVLAGGNRLFSCRVLVYPAGPVQVQQPVLLLQAGFSAFESVVAEAHRSPPGLSL